MTANKKMGWGLVALWTAATAITWAGGSNYLPLVLENVPTEMGRLALLVLWMFILVIGGAAGLLLGAAQWWVLRYLDDTRITWRWVAATAIGMALGWNVGSYLGLWTVGAIDFPPREQLLYGQPIVPPNPLELVLRGAVVGAATGFVIGLAQWFVLRKSVPNAGRWIQVSVVAWLLGLVLYHIAYVASGGPLLSDNWDRSISEGAWESARRLSHAIGWLVGGTAVGVITAMSMRYLLASPNPANVQPPQTQGIRRIPMWQ